MKRLTVLVISVCFVLATVSLVRATSQDFGIGDNELSILQFDLENSFSSSSYPSSDPPSNWSPTAGPYSILGTWIYSGDGSCWIEGHGNAIMQIRNGKLKFTGTGSPGTETVTYVKESYTLKTTADTVHTEDYSSEKVTNFLVSNNFAQRTEATGLIQEIFLLSDKTMKGHKYGSTMIGTTSIQNVDIWYSALRDDSSATTGGSGGGGGGCNLGLSPASFVFLIPLIFLFTKKINK